MEPRGDQWYCPIHKIYLDSSRTPTPEEYVKIIADKDELIAKLKHQNQVLNTENAHLNELVNYFEGK